MQKSTGQSDSSSIVALEPAVVCPCDEYGHHGRTDHGASQASVRISSTLASIKDEGTTPKSFVYVAKAQAILTNSAAA